MAREVLLISEAPIATVQLLEQVLEAVAATTSLRTRSTTLADLTADDFTPTTFPLLVRTADLAAHRLVRELRRQSIPYGFYLDDNFWLLDPDTEIGRYYAGRALRQRLEQIVRGAHTVIASTPLLRDYVRRFNRATIQLESFFDFSLVPELPSVQRTRATVRGGFAASAHRGSDLEPVLADIVSALQAHPELEFEIIGVDDDALARHPRIRTFAYLDSYAEYSRFQRRRAWDFGLAPLGGALSNLYKTDNKFREYAAHGIPGIYQDLPPYAAVRDGETGLLAGGTRTWRDAIELYVSDPALRERVRVAARADAEDRCSLDKIAPLWAEFFESAPEAGPTVASLRARLRRRRRPHEVSRARLLVAYGLERAREQGILATGLQTVRFVARRVVARIRG